MHILRVRIHRPGDTAERLLAILGERRDARLVGREPRVRGLLPREVVRRPIFADVERDQVLAEVEDDLDAIARELQLVNWRETIGVD
jgi:hypothetical protein